MSNSKSDRKLILDEWLWIYANFPKFSLIADMKNATIKNNTIGSNVGHFKASNYIQMYNSTFENELYAICLADYSLICMYYEFDSRGKTTSHNLMYIPCPTNEEENELLQEAISKYLRVDYDISGYKKTIHTYVHLHTNIYKSNMRIPVAHIITPKDFVYVVLKYIYHCEESLVDKLLVDKKRENMLAVEDENKLRINIGKKS